MIYKIEVINKYLELFPCITDIEKEIIEKIKNNLNIEYRQYLNQINIIRLYTLFDFFNKYIV